MSLWGKDRKNKGRLNMKIIHYIFGLPPVRTGGLPKYALDLMGEQARMGHEVSMLVPGPIMSGEPKDVSIKKWKKQNGIPCYRILNPIYIPNAYGINQPKAFMPAAPVENYIEWLVDMQPDVIHVHSILGLHKEFFQAANQLRIPVVFTTHDYFGLCPKIDYLKENQNCETQDWSECIQCCKNAYGLRRLKLEQSDVYRKYCESNYLMRVVHGKVVTELKKVLSCVRHGKSEKKSDVCIEDDNKRQGETMISCDKELQKEYRDLQQYYVDIFNMIDYYHFNSKQTREVYEKILGAKAGKVIPVMNRGICDRRREKKYGQTLRIGYLGTQMPMKGYGYLLQELDKVYESGRCDFYLNTYLIENEDTRQYVRNHKPFPFEQQEMVYDAMDVLVVPSLWRETFGMVVLEALSYGVPVLISENVGAKMLIEEYVGCGRIFEIAKGKLANVIEEIYDERKILVEMNQSIIKSSMDLGYRKHVEKMLSMYSAKE